MAAKRTNLLLLYWLPFSLFWTSCEPVKRGDATVSNSDSDNLSEAILLASPHFFSQPHNSSQSVVAITAGSYHACALMDNNSVKCWGSNIYGNLGQGDAYNRGDQPGELGENLKAVDLGDDRTAQAIAAGGAHSCALLDNGNVKCWGWNASGQLGQGDIVNRGDRPGEMGNNLLPVDLGSDLTAVSISTGEEMSCAILNDGSVKCWGDNSVGQLGQGDTVNRGAYSSEMGNNLLPVALGTGHTARTIAAGKNHACALLDDYSVKCWGDNSYGQLGQSDVENRGDNPGEMGDNLPPIDLGSGRTARAISAQSFHTCALLDDRTVKCWGRNAVGQLGQGDTKTRGDEPGEMGDNLAPINLGSGRTVLAMSVGTYSHTCALLDSGAVKCWGRNRHGALGLGDTRNRGAAPDEMGNHLERVNLGLHRTAVAIENGCALLDNGRVKCWGDNSLGKLGQGDISHRGDNESEMGDYLRAIDLGS